MQSFFRKHSDFVLISLTVIFLAILVGYFFWGITTLVATLNQAINIGKLGQAHMGFDLEGAASLNLKGLVK